MGLPDSNFVSRLKTLAAKNAKPPPLPAAPAPKPAMLALLNLQEADRFRNLLLFAKSKVEGYFSGKHKSPYYGSNVEFADYKEYVSGEDIANIDWRVYGRTRKLFLRKYEEETDMVAYLVVDASASMQFRGSGVETKFRQAIKIAAVLAYLMARQGDKVSLTLFAEKVVKYLPPGGTMGHLYNLVSALEAAKPSSKTSIGNALGECASIFKKRGCLIVISDFLGGDENLFDAISRFVHRKYEVLLLQVFDPDELELPSTDVARFVDMETGEHVEVEPDEIRREYRQTMQDLVARIGENASRRGVQHFVIQTANTYLQAIEAWLGFRGRIRK